MVGFIRRLLSHEKSVARDPLNRETPEALAQSLLIEGCALWSKDPRRINEAAEFVERAWAAAPSAQIAIQLVIMFDRMNRHDEAIAILKQAFKKFPSDDEVRCYAGMTLFRHGAPKDIIDFCEEVQRIDPGDLFTQSIIATFADFQAQVSELAARLGEPTASKKLYLLAVAVWGRSYIDDFLNYTCCALFAQGNLPDLSALYDVHFIIFTTSDGQEYLQSSDVFRRLLSLVTVHVRIYCKSVLPEREEVDAKYGARLGEYYWRARKFSLMSSAHYVALEVGRRLDALVTVLGADNVFNDTALARMGELMAQGADVVLVAGFRLLKKSMIDTVEQKYRGEDGTISMNSGECARVLAAHVQEDFFVDAKRFADFPLMLCWRVADEGVLVHANHYHPYCIRASYLTGPLLPTTDPVDGRFLHRALLNDAKVHIVQDTSITVSDWGDVPVIERQPGAGKRFSEEDVGLWLWGFWDRFRAPLFRSPLRIGRDVSSSHWESVESGASETIDKILEVTIKHESSIRERRS